MKIIVLIQKPAEEISVGFLSFGVNAFLRNLRPQA